MACQTKTLPKNCIYLKKVDLLEYLVKFPYISQITNLQIQFHDFVANAHARMLHIQNELSKTHVLTYQFPFIWENWKLK